MKRLISLLLIAVIITSAACLTGCASFEKGKNNRSLEKYSETYFDVFDTVTVFLAYCPDEESFKELSDKVHKRLLEYHNMFDIYYAHEGVNGAYEINKNAGKEPVEVPKEMIKLIEQAKELYVKTDGRVNIALGAVLALWHDARNTGLNEPDKSYIPDMEELKKAANHCKIDDVVVDYTKGTVYLADPEMSIDLGAIAKGFATNQVAEEMKAEGYDHFAISAGGNVKTVGARGDGTNWVVAVQNPDLDNSGDYMDVMGLAGTSLVTSGVYQRYYEYNGEKYHHIIDPATLKPENRYLSLSIITEDSGYADALSTGLFNMDLKEGQEFVESLENVEALWIMPDMSLIKSSGWDDYH